MNEMFKTSTHTQILKTRQQGEERNQEFKTKSLLFFIQRNEIMKIADCVGGFGYNNGTTILYVLLLQLFLHLDFHLDFLSQTNSKWECEQRKWRKEEKAWSKLTAIR